MKVRQYMSQPVLTITPKTPFRQAFDLMHSRGFHHLPIVEEERVLGVIAKSDLLLAAANFGSAEVAVDEIMRRAPVCVTENAQLKDAVQLLLQHHIGCLPVLNEGEKLVGIITETDIFKITAGLLNDHPAAREPAALGGAKSSPMAV
jgi:acetoin utilization protein AcuB